MLVWFTNQAPGQARLHNKTLSQDTKKQQEEEDIFTVLGKLKFSIAFLNLIQSITFALTYKL